MGLMQIPRRVDYGLRAVIYLSDQDPEKCCSIAEIAQAARRAAKVFGENNSRFDSRRVDQIEKRFFRRIYVGATPGRDFVLRCDYGDRRADLGECLPGRGVGLRSATPLHDARRVERSAARDYGRS